MPKASKTPSLPKYLMDVRVTSEHRGWVNLSVRIRSYFATQFSPTVGDDALTLHWQAGADTPLRWYGGKMELNAADSDHALTLLRVLHKAQGEASLYSGPMAIIRGLEDAGATEAEYSPTLRRWVPLAELPGHACASFRDVDSTGGCTVHAYANEHAGEDTIRRELARAFAKGDYMEALERWIQGGKPYRIMDTEGFHGTGWRDLLQATANDLQAAYDRANPTNLVAEAAPV